MGSVAIVVIVNVIQRNGLAPRCTSFELFVLDIDTGVNDVDIDAFATGALIFVLIESAERELRAVADARETLKKGLRVDESHSWRNERTSNVPREQSFEVLGS